MRLGILTLSVISQKSISSYNLQEVGLANALSPFCDEIMVWRPTDGVTQRETDDSGKVKILFFHSAHLGSNGWFDLSILDKTIDVLICFSDLQLYFRRISRWAKKNDIRLYPYVGTVTSSSSFPLTKALMRFVATLNQAKYRKMTCFAKNNYVKEKLEAGGKNQVFLIIPGIEVHAPEIIPSQQSLRNDLGIKGNEKIILFVGRFEEEKGAYEMVKLFHELLMKDADHRLLMVGSGSLDPIIRKYVIENHIEDKVDIIPYIRNTEMWMPYVVCCCFVNLARTEIVGMSVMEAMSFGKKVVALKAPGPCTIIENGISGYITNDREETISRILNGELDADLIKKRIIEDLSWERSAEMMMKIIEEGNN